MSETGRSLPDHRVYRRRNTALAVAAGFAIAAGASVFSSGVTAAPAPPAPSSMTISVSGTCALERIGTQFVKCDNLTGAGVRAPAYIPRAERIGLGEPGVQRMGLGDHR